jgi:hypothetical protein
MHSPVMVSSQLQPQSRKHAFHCGSAVAACYLACGKGTAGTVEKRELM